MRYDSGVRYDSGARYDEPDPVPPLTTQMPKYIKLGLGTKSYEQKVAQGNAIYAGVNGHAAIYTNPNPLPATFLAGVNDLAAKKTARDTAFEAAKAATEALHTSAKAYDALTTQLAFYAENITAGDPAKLELGGFELRRTPAPIGDLGIVENLQLASNGAPGRLYARWQPLYGAKSYEVETCEDPVSDEEVRVPDVQHRRQGHAGRPDERQEKLGPRPRRRAEQPRPVEPAGLHDRSVNPPTRPGPGIISFHWGRVLLSGVGRAVPCAP